MDNDRLKAFDASDLINRGLAIVFLEVAKEQTPQITAKIGPVEEVDSVVRAIGVATKMVEEHGLLTPSIQQEVVTKLLYEKYSRSDVCAVTGLFNRAHDEYLAQAEKLHKLKNWCRPKKIRRFLMLNQSAYKLNT